MTPSRPSTSERHKPLPASGQGGKAAGVLRPAILHLASDLDQGFDGREIVDLAIQSHRAGWRPLIVSSGGPLALEAERAAVRHIRAPLHRRDLLSRWRARRRIEALIQKERPALVHAHGFGMVALTHALNLPQKLPLLLDLKEPTLPTPGLRHRLEMAAVRQARFRVPSLFMATHLQRDFGLATPFLYHIGPGIDLGWFDPGRVTPERLHALSRLWRLPEQSTVIVTSAPLAPGSGHHALLEALAPLNKAPVHVVMIGRDGGVAKRRAELEALVALHGLEGKVVMPESCADWPAACWLASLAVTANTAPRGQALEILAAQAMGRPVVVTDCGASREMVHPGETAWVVPSGDREALTNALAEAVRMNGAQRLDLANRTRAFVAESFPQDVWVRSILDVYEAMLALPVPVTAPAATPRAA